jgi:hypothetical protein
VHLRLEGLLVTVAIAAAMGATGVAAPQSAAPGARAPSSAEIAAAVAVVAKDPKLGGESKIRSLHWVSSDETEKPATPPPLWIIGFFQYLAQAGGLLLWVAGAIAVAIVAVWIYRVATMHVPPMAPRAVAPTNQVRDLDIRPSSLPDDVGAAALELLMAGRIREALSLLYRGALSRAVHRFGVTIGASFTEGEVLAAVGATQDQRVTGYFADLVGVWRSVVYAGEPVAPEAIRPLCADFHKLLDGSAP